MPQKRRERQPDGHLDHPPELTANALRDWCRFSGAGTSYIEPGSPWQNPWVESYVSRIRDELLGIERFDTLFEGAGPRRRLASRVPRVPSPFRPRDAQPSAFSQQWRTNHHTSSYYRSRRPPAVHRCL